MLFAGRLQGLVYCGLAVWVGASPSDTPLGLLAATIDDVDPDGGNGQANVPGSSSKRPVHKSACTLPLRTTLAYPTSALATVSTRGMTARASVRPRSPLTKSSRSLRNPCRSSSHPGL